jgi:hypothetical protein
MEDRLAQACHDSGLPFFLEASMLAAWELWKISNDLIFNRQPPSGSKISRTNVPLSPLDLVLTCGKLSTFGSMLSFNYFVRTLVLFLLFIK